MPAPAWRPGREVTTTRVAGLIPPACAHEGGRVAVSWIHGCAVQAMIDPGYFDTDEYLAAVRGIVGQLA